MNYPPNQTLINSFVLHLFIWGPVSGVFKIRGKRYCVLKRVLFAVAMGSMGCYSMLQLDMPQASTSSKAIAPQIRAKYPAVMTWCHLCCDLSDQIASKYGMGQNMSKHVKTGQHLLPVTTIFGGIIIHHQLFEGIYCSVLTRHMTWRYLDQLLPESCHWRRPSISPWESHPLIL